jgi:hypothetical protein
MEKKYSPIYFFAGSHSQLNVVTSKSQPCSHSQLEIYKIWPILRWIYHYLNIKRTGEQVLTYTFIAEIIINIPNKHS